RWTVFSILNPTTKRQLSHPENPTACDEQQQCCANRYLRVTGAGLCQFLCGLRLRVGGRGRKLDAPEFDCLVLGQIADLILKGFEKDGLLTLSDLPQTDPTEQPLAGAVLVLFLVDLRLRLLLAR